ncbi:MAG: hypothetical protein EBR30_08975 [Cytophagia bacterium]|nr:hypothetical protein [Cytophagia bacterium]
MVKTWKIGEYAMGGIIRVSTKPRGVFSVECMAWDTKEVIQWRYVHGFDELMDYLEDLTTHYYADKIVSHFKTKLI